MDIYEKFKDQGGQLLKLKNNITNTNRNLLFNKL